MMHQIKFALFFVFFMTLSTLGLASSKMRLTNIKLGAIRITPTTFDTGSFIEAGWTPLLELDDLAFRGEFSWSGTRNKAKERFYVTNYEAYAMVTAASVFVFEAGGGMQYWHGGNGGAAPVASGGMAFRCGEFLDRLYITFSYVFMNGNPTKVYKSGFGFNL